MDPIRLELLGQAVAQLDADPESDTPEPSGPAVEGQTTEPPSGTVPVDPGAAPTDPMSCWERLNRYLDEWQATVQAHSACTQDSECRTVWVASCGWRCAEAVSDELGYRDAIQALNVRYCPDEPDECFGVEEESANVIRVSCRDGRCRTELY